MSNNNVAILSIMSKFDEKSAKDAAKRANKVYDEELSNLGNVNFDEKLLKNFDKAMNLLKGKFKKVNLSFYTNNLLDSIFSDKDIKEKSTDINTFIKKIDLLKKASSGQDINAFNTFSAKQIDALISRTEKLAKKQKEINEKAREYNREATKIAKPSRTISTIDKKYGSQDYSKTLDLLKKTLAIEKDFTKEQNESIENLAKMVQLYQTMEKSEPQKGTAENIRYSKDLLTVTQKIKEEREKIDSFTRKGATKFINENELDSINKVNDYTIIKSKEDFVKENLNTLKTQEIKLQSDLTAYISNSVQRNLQKVTSEVNGVVDKAEKRVEGLQNKIDTLKGGSSENSNNQLIENIVDETNIKTLEEIEDRLYAIYDKDLEGEATNKELKEYIQLYKQYSDLVSKDDTVKFDPSLKEEYEFILQQSDLLKRYSEQLDNVINKNKEINTEVENTNKSIKDQNNSVNSYNNLESDLKEIKDAISGINEKIDSINNSDSFENIETQLGNLDERVLSVSGHVDKLIDSVNLLSSLSLSDIQKTTLPLYNGINELFKANNGNRISGYWEDLKKEVEGSNVQLRELLKNVGLFDSKSNQLKLISDGMENSGGIIGDDKVLIARKNHGKNFEEKTLLKQKLDEAYKAGINVSRILDIIGSKESDVFFDIQEKAQGNILGNIYGQGEDFVNTDWLEATDEQINKFVSDLIKLQKMGINVESNLTNIMYDKKNGFSFIDMDLDTTNFDNNAELLQDHMMRIFGDLEDFYLDNNDTINANIVSKARERFESLSKQVQQAYAEAQDSHSPSKDFQQLENDAVDGIVIGANENEGKLKNIGKQMAENVKEGFKEGIKNISLDELNILSDISLQSKISDSVTDQIITNNKKKQDATKAQEKVNDTKKINSILDKSFDTKNEWFDLNSAIKIIKDKSSYKELSYGFDGFHEEVQKITSAIVNMNENGQESTIDYMIQVQKLLNLYKMYRKEAEIPKNMSQAKKFESFLENEQLNAHLNPELDTDSNIFKGFLNVIDQFIDVTTNKFIPLETRVQEIISEFGQISTITSSTPAIEQQIKSESELNAEIEKRENTIRELQQLQEKLTVHEDFHSNDRYFADQLPTEEEIRKVDKRIKQLTGTNNIFNVDKLIQDRNEWLSEVKYSLEEYDDLIKANDQKALDEYTTKGLSHIGGAESFFGYEDNNFSIASKFVEEKEKIQNEINDLYADLDKLDEKMNLDSNNYSVDNTVQSQEKLQAELKETETQAEKTAQAVKEVTSATVATPQESNISSGSNSTIEQQIKQQNKLQDEIKETIALTNEYGEVIDVYRGTHGLIGNGNVSNRYHGGTFWTSNRKLATQSYADGNKVTHANLYMRNPYLVHGGGADWDQLTLSIKQGEELEKYLENVYASINDVFSKIQNTSGIEAGHLFDVFDGQLNFTDFENGIQKPIESLKDFQNIFESIDYDNSKIPQAQNYINQLYDLFTSYSRISQLSEKGVLNTNEVVEIAKALKYDGVVFNGIRDGSDDSSDIFVTFEEKQSKVIDMITAAQLRAEEEQQLANILVNTRENLYKTLKSLDSKQVDEFIDKSAFNFVTDGSYMENLGEVLGKADPTDSIDNIKNKIREYINEVVNEFENAQKQIADSTDQTKDAFPDSSTNTNPETEGMEQVEKATKEAVQAKKDFATANEGVQSSIDGSENPLKLEAELMEQIARSAREAADAKKEFVNANKQVKDSAKGSNNDLVGGHSENAEPSGVKKYKKKGYKAHDTGNHDNEKKVSNKAELEQALRELQSEIIASIDESTSFVKEVTDFYDSQDNLVKTQMKIGDKNGSMRTYTTSYSMDKDGNATAWTSHIETQKIAEQIKQKERLAEATRKLRQEEKQSSQDSVNSALKDQVFAWKQIQSIREKIAKADNLDVINQLQETKKYYQQQYLDATKILKSNQDLYDTQGQLNRLKQIELEATAKISQYQSKNAESVSKYNQSLQKSAREKLSKYTDSSKYTPEFIERVNSKIGEIEQLNITKPEDVAKLKTIDDEVQKIVDDSKLLENKLVKQESHLADIISQMKIFASQNTNMSSLQKKNLYSIIDHAEELKNAGKVTAQEIEKIKISFSELKAEVASTGNMGKNFFSQISNRLTDMNSKFVAQFLSWQDWIRYIQQGISTIRDLDAAMTEVRKVSNATEAQYKSFQKTISSTAKEIATTNKELLNSSADFLRLGYNLDEASDLAKNATLFVNVGDGVDITEATEDMITAMKAFDIQAEDSIKIVDDYNQIGKYILPKHIVIYGDFLILESSYNG